VLKIPTFATRFGEGVLNERWRRGRESRIYFKINVAGEEKIATFAARFGRTERRFKTGILKRGRGKR
jgi:hypothetical protein